MADGGLGTIALIAVILIIATVFTVLLILSIRMAGKKNLAFFQQASIVRQELPPGTPVTARFQPAPGSAHAVWLDIGIAGPSETTGFDLWLDVKLFLPNGPAPLIQGTFPVTFDDEQDARGLPNAMGISALNSSGMSGVMGNQLKTILRAFRFDAPPFPAGGEIQVRLVPHPGTSFQYARLLVTVRDAP